MQPFIITMWGNRCNAFSTTSIDRKNEDAGNHQAEFQIIQMPNWWMHAIPHSSRCDMKQQMSFEPDLNDPAVHIVDKNWLKCQFYKAVERICEIKRSEQANLLQWRYPTDDFVCWLLGMTCG